MRSRDEEQEYAIQCIREQLSIKGKALCVAATGYGKGTLIQKIAEKMQGSLLVIVPRVNLVEDIANRIGDCSIYCASLGSKEIGKITVATIQSIRGKEVEFDVVIFDEAHNYKTEVLESFNCKYKIALTATPFDMMGFIYE